VDENGFLDCNLELIERYSKSSRSGLSSPCGRHLQPSISSTRTLSPMPPRIRAADGGGWAGVGSMPLRSRGESIRYFVPTPKRQNRPDRRHCRSVLVDFFLALGGSLGLRPSGPVLNGSAVREAKASSSAAGARTSRSSRLSCRRKHMWPATRPCCSRSASTRTHGTAPWPAASWTRGCPARSGMAASSLIAGQSHPTVRASALRPAASVTQP